MNRARQREAFRRVRWRSRDLVGLVFASDPDSKRRHRQIARALPVLLASR